MGRVCGQARIMQAVCLNISSDEAGGSSEHYALQRDVLAVNFREAHLPPSGVERHTPMCLFH